MRQGIVKAQTAFKRSDSVLSDRRDAVPGKGHVGSGHAISEVSFACVEEEAELGAQPLVHPVELLIGQNLFLL